MSWAGAQVDQAIARYVSGEADDERALVELERALSLEDADREQAAQREAMAEVWASLARHDERGAGYLAGRGIAPSELERRDVVRYMRAGHPAVALRDLATGAIVGVQYRRIDGREPRLMTLSGSQVSGAALAGHLDQLDADGVSVAVVTEGLADCLVAHLAWPSCLVLGAPGAGQLTSVMAALAPRIVALRGHVLMSPDSDDIGVVHATRACRAARDAGIPLADRGARIEGPPRLHLIDVHPHHDLADAWAAGWRPAPW